MCASILFNCDKRTAKKPKWLMLLLRANLLGIEFGCTNKTTALHKSQGAILQNLLHAFEALSIFLLAALQFLCQIWLSKIYWYVLRPRPLWDIFFFFEKWNPSHCFFARCLRNLQTEFRGNPSNSQSITINSFKQDTLT